MTLASVAPGCSSSSPSTLHKHRPFHQCWPTSACVQRKKAELLAAGFLLWVCCGSVLVTSAGKTCCCCCCTLPSRCSYCRSATVWRTWTTWRWLRTTTRRTVTSSCCSNRAVGSHQFSPISAASGHSDDFHSFFFFCKDMN